MSNSKLTNFGKSDINPAMILDLGENRGYFMSTSKSMTGGKSQDEGTHI